MKGYRKEIVWLFVLATITVALIQIAFGASMKSFLSQIDIQFHDTYFVTDAFRVFALLFTNLVFWFYFIRALFKRFKELKINWVLFSVAPILIIITSFLIRITGTIEASSRWTVYPPEGLQEGVVVLTENSYWVLNNYLLAYQVLQIVILGCSGLMIGRNGAVRNNKIVSL